MYIGDIYTYIGDICIYTYIDVYGLHIHIHIHLYAGDKYVCTYIYTYIHISIYTCNVYISNVVYVYMI